MAEYKVLITTSGVGSRLGAFTEYTNKALVRVGDKAAISHILDCYGSSVPVVVTLGVFGQQVRDYLELAHPDRTFEFVEVDKYEGPGSSLGYSMWQARENLQCPFVYHCSDAVMSGVVVPDPNEGYNWLGGCLCEDVAQYRTMALNSGCVGKINDKGAVCGLPYAYVGVAGVLSYGAFWDALGELVEGKQFGESLSDVHVYARMGVEWRYRNMPYWHDVGNVDSLRRAREAFPHADYAMEKYAEGTYILRNKVIKFFADAKAAHNRVRRANEVLPDVVPKITGERSHFYRYEYAGGRPLSKTITPERMGDLLDWASTVLWTEAGYYNEELYKQRTREFYGAKTIDRLGELSGAVDVIGAVKLLNQIDWDNFGGEAVGRIHGDFILDNILDQRYGFKLIDWRQDFAGGRDVFDIYYDFAKLQHSLVFSHELIERGLYDASKGEILRSDNLCDCQAVLREWVASRGYDLKRLDILTAMVWLNMAPLHKPPLNELLYRLGERKLCRALKT